MLVFSFAILNAPHADELSRTDKLRTLYSNKVSFDEQGIPLISIRIAEGVRDVTLESTSPIQVLPDGKGGSTVQAGTTWRVRLLQSKPAVVDYFLVLESGHASELETLSSRVAIWQKQGAKAQLHEQGTLFGLKGRVFDNRAYVILDGPFPSESSAQKSAERFVQRKLLTANQVLIIPELKQRPTAELIAEDQDGRTRIRVRDALWFESGVENAPLRVRTANGASAGYWGQIYITVDRFGSLAVVNELGSDKLLAGLVPAEIFPSAPFAALQAQSVAARGDLLSKLGTRHLADPYLICAEQHCQVYRGAGHEHPATTKAIGSTRGQVLVRPDGTLIKALYSAVCGGHSEHNDMAWPQSPDPNLRGKFDDERKNPSIHEINEKTLERWLASTPDSWCSRAGINRDRVRWTERIPIQTVNDWIRPFGIGSLVDIVVLERGVSGRARFIELHGSSGKKQLRGELNIRKLFGNLKSSMFLIEKETDSAGKLVAFRFRGGGWGHGVGMCQTGAIGMAKANKSFKEILLHYYSNASVEQIY